MPRAPKQTFNDIVREAVEDFQNQGFDSTERLEYWQRRLRQAAVESMIPENQADKMLRDALMAVYVREVENFGVLRKHPGLARWTVDKLKPQLRAELGRRQLASIQLIKLNREQEIDAMTRRFAGWATSVPPGGSDQTGREETRKLRKTLSGLSYRERRLMIDQGHKLQANISAVIAQGSGALAGVWRSHWKQTGYDYREDHKERDQELYAVRDNWAMGKGLMKLGGHKYTDEITQPSEEPYCRCWYRWVYNLRDLPVEMVTEKGKAEMARVRAALQAA